MKNCVLLFNEGGRAALYGIGTYIEQMTQHVLKDNNVFLYIIHLNSSKKEFEIQNNNNYEILYFPSILKDNYIYSRNVWCILRQYINFLGFNKVFVYLNYFYERFFVRIMKSDFPDLKVIYTVHYQDWCFYLKGNVSYFENIIKMENGIDLVGDDRIVLELYNAEKVLFNEVDEIRCLSSFTYDLLQSHYNISKDKMVLCNNVLKKISVDKDRSLLKKYYYISENEKIVLYVGRLDEIKGVEFLLDAFNIVLKSYLNCRLIVIGDGDFSFYLNRCKYIWNKITFVGRLERNELYNFYQIADVGVMPSFHEQCSFVFIEMMMFGIPVVGTNTTGLSEMIENEVNGTKLILCEDKRNVSIDVKSMAKAILKYLEMNDSDILKYKENCFRIFDDKYNEDKCCFV